MKLFFRLLSFGFFGLFMTACCIHQWPEKPESVDPTVRVPLRLVYNPDMYLWEHHYDSNSGVVVEDNPSLNIYPGYPGTSDRYSNLRESGLIHTQIKVYTKGSGRKCVDEYSFNRVINGTYDTDTTLVLQLEASKEYEVVAWSQLTENRSDALFYDGSDFSGVRIAPSNYRANTDYRDGFNGRVSLNLSGETTPLHIINMKRPMGKFELVATDLEEFLEKETARRSLSKSRASADEYQVVISFPVYYPSSYSVLEERLENSATGVGFRSKMVVGNLGEASLGFEYVLLNDIPDSGVQTRLDIYFQDGIRVAGSSTFTIPMRRDHHTLLRGAFLTTNEDGGGIGIDPDFSGDHNVIW